MRRQELKLEVAEKKRWRFSLGITRKKRTKKEEIRGTAHGRHFGGKVRKGERRFGHMLRRGTECVVEG